jgi:spermidine synthase
MTNKVKEMISYVMPLQIETCSSEHNAILEVTLSNGRYVLDSEKCNYSYGALYTIFKKVFRDLNFQDLNFSNCLLLGLGGGSIVNLLRKEYHLTMPITALEIDPVVIDLGKKYFGLNDYANLTMINEDAFEFVKRENDSFDLIIVDILVNDEVPTRFHSREFVSYLEKMSHGSTIILFNKVLSSERSRRDYTNLTAEMADAFGSVNILTYEVHNVTNKIVCVNTGRVKESQRTENYLTSTESAPALLRYNGMNHE